jgi:hypothetical protein
MHVASRSFAVPCPEAANCRADGWLVWSSLLLYCATHELSQRDWARPYCTATQTVRTPDGLHYQTAKLAALHINARTVAHT